MVVMRALHNRTFYITAITNFCIILFCLCRQNIKLFYYSEASCVSSYKNYGDLEENLKSETKILKKNKGFFFIGF